MSYSESFLISTARDYGMTVNQVKLITRGCASTSEFYNALEHELANRTKVAGYGQS